MEKSRTVVLIDDNETARDFIKSLLEDAGFTVIAFEFPKEALFYIKEFKNAIDLVVTDFDMPGISGMEVIRAVKEMAPELKIIMASGNIAEEEKSEAVGLGAANVFKKPINIKEFLEFLKSI